MSIYNDEPYYHDVDLTADDRVSRFVLSRAVSDSRTHTCIDTKVSFLEGDDGTYGCDTGCEYLRLTAKLTCKHFPEGIEYEYGDFGMLYNLFPHLDTQ